MAKSRKFREQHGKILLEGHRLIRDALEAGAELQTLFFSSLRMKELKELPEAALKGASLVKVKFKDIKLWSDLVAPQGLVGEARGGEEAAARRDGGCLSRQADVAAATRGAGSWRVLVGVGAAHRGARPG